MKPERLSKNTLKERFNMMYRSVPRFFCVFQCVIIMSIVTFPAFAQTSTPVANRAVANRFVNGETIFYADLLEAFNAASGTSIDRPDEIVLLADCVLNEPIIITDGKHIRLISNDGEKMIRRGSGNIEEPVMWVRGYNASFSLGKDGMTGSIIVDGGYVASPSIIAESPIAAVSGQYSKFVMYDNVTLQNNYNIGNAEGTSFYRNGAGVFIRAEEGSSENQSEFIMKGGTIQGNINNTQNDLACGGGVLITGFGLFTMEGGVIANNTAYRTGGGFHTGSRGSFTKTGGIIYGEDAPENMRNTVINGDKYPWIPSTYGYAVCVPQPTLMRYRDDTVGENDNLSYIGTPSGYNAIFGEGENWDNTDKDTQKRLTVIFAISALLAAVAAFFIVRNIRRKRMASASKKIIAGAPFSPREKEICDMLLTDVSVKQIAYDLALTYSGVNFHIKNIYAKLGVKSRTELLVKFAK
jgi:DNA-binding CsgD family transcriptional regulator